MQKIYSVDKIANLLEVSRQTVYNRVRARTIAAPDFKSDKGTIYWSRKTTERILKEFKKER